LLRVVLDFNVFQEFVFGINQLTNQLTPLFTHIDSIQLLWEIEKKCVESKDKQKKKKTEKEEEKKWGAFLIVLFYIKMLGSEIEKLFLYIYKYIYRKSHLYSGQRSITHDVTPCCKLHDESQNMTGVGWRYVKYYNASQYHPSAASI